jgi:hypothetical protein
MDSFEIHPSFPFSVSSVCPPQWNLPGLGEMEANEIITGNGLSGSRNMICRFFYNLHDYRNDECFLQKIIHVKTRLYITDRVQKIPIIIRHNNLVEPSVLCG